MVTYLHLNLFSFLGKKETESDHQIKSARSSIRAGMMYYNQGVNTASDKYDISGSFVNNWNKA